MSLRFTMDYKKDKEGGSLYTGQGNRIYRPLPDKAGTKGYNDIFVPLFQPSNWKMFNPSVEVAQHYGLIGGGKQICVSPDLGTFYFRLMVHPIDNFQRPDGSTGTSFVICPVKMNDYLVKFLNCEPMFDHPTCPFCEEADKWWNQFNARWEALGYTKDQKKALDADTRQSVVIQDPVLKNAKDVAKKYTASSRYMINVFDHSKATGARPLDEGQTGVEYQIWFSPKSVWDDLINIYEVMAKENDTPFFDLGSPQGAHILTVIKDTTECSGNNLMRTKYSVMHGKKHIYDPAWLAYLSDSRNTVDPSDFVFLATKDELRYYVSSEAARPDPEWMSGPAQPPVQTVPQVSLSQLPMQTVAGSQDRQPRIPQTVAGPQVAQPPMVPQAPMVAPVTIGVSPSPDQTIAGPQIMQPAPQPVTVPQVAPQPVTVPQVAPQPVTVPQVAPQAPRPMIPQVQPRPVPVVPQVQQPVSPPQPPMVGPRPTINRPSGAVESPSEGTHAAPKGSSSQRRRW